MRDIEMELLSQIEEAMRESGKTQAEFAAQKGVTRQSVNPYFKGKKSLLTDTGKDILNFLGLDIKLVPRENPKKELDK